MKFLPYITASALIVAASAASAAPPADRGGATVNNATGCLAVDTAGAEFFDTAGRFHQVITPSGNINQSCTGMLPADAVLPATPVTLTQATDPTFVCLQRWEETIQPDGTFGLTCHLK